MHRRQFDGGIKMKAGRAAFGSGLLVLVLLAVGGQGPARAAQAAACGLPASSPVWIDYGEGSVAPAVRTVFARPGVVVASSGTLVPQAFRSRGAATMYFELHLPALVGTPADPADPALVTDAADRLFTRAVASSACATPWIALNELLGAQLPTPWSASNATYRADVLALMQGLAERGATPFLFVHGDPNLAGDAGSWWRQVAQAGVIVYELYFNAAHISELGTVIGNRRMRLGGRSLVAQYGAIGVAPSRLGIALGFHSSPREGIAGRQGLQPREAWFRVVKWEALATRQVAEETGIGSVWSWGWAAFSPDAADSDKPAAACVYLWTRDHSLCDGPEAAGAGFNRSLTEGQIVLPPGVTCTFVGGLVESSAVDALAALTHSRHTALSAIFARRVLQPTAPITRRQVLTVERQAIIRSFHGNRRGYLEALTRAHATLPVARAIIADELRRQAIAANLAAADPAQTTLEWTAGQEAAAIDTATCLHDELPGGGGFPQTDAREVGVVPLLAKLPFLFADTTPPSTPRTPSATGRGSSILLSWPAGPEADLAGYEVFRAPTSGGPYEQVSPFLDHPAYLETPPQDTGPLYYVIRAVDTSGNLSSPSAEALAS
jgi:hypothetical protein